MTTAFDNQIQNRNFLSPVGFKFTLSKDPSIFLAILQGYPDKVGNTFQLI